MELLPRRTTTEAKQNKNVKISRQNRWIPGVLAAFLLVLLGLVQPQSAADAGTDSGLFAFGARSGIALSSPHSAGSNPLIYWSELEPQKGVYNWAALDKAISDAANAGKRIAPRIYTNISGYGAATPSWFFQQPGAMHYYPSYSAQSKGMKAPVSWDPVFQEHFSRFLAALGERYDGNATIEFFQTNAGGGVYGEMLLATSTSYYPSGWTAARQADSIRYWTDRWLATFPSTDLALVFNPLGNNLAEVAVPYAAERGMFIQMNSPWLDQYAVDLFTSVALETRVILEVEDGGGRSATGDAFDKMIARVFGYGFPIDYLMLHYKSFSNTDTAAKLPTVNSRLRTFESTEQVESTAPIIEAVESVEAGSEVATEPVTDPISTTPGIYSPARGSTWPGSTVEFRWNPTPGASMYWISITASTGVNIVNKKAGGATSTSLTLAGLPTDGKTYYVQLSAQVDGAWKRYNTSYKAASGGGGSDPVIGESVVTSATPGIYSPARGSTWPGTTVTFNWNPTPNATIYWISITGANGVSVVNKRAGGASATSITLSGLPADGKTYYVQFSVYVNGKWTRYNYSYKAS